MKTLQELKALKTERANRVQALIRIMDGDTLSGIVGRALTDAENAELLQIRDGAQHLENEISTAEYLEDQKRIAAQTAAQRMFTVGGNHRGDNEQKVQTQYSITRAAKYVAGERVDAGLEIEQGQEAKRQADAINLPYTGKGLLMPAYLDKRSQAHQERATAGTAADAGNLIATNQMATSMGYAPTLYVQALGATMHMGLTGINTLPIADMTAVSAFVGEGDSFTAITSVIRKPSLTAKGLMSKLTNSWFLKAQAGPESDRILLATLERSEENALNTNIIKRANANSSHGLFGASDIVDVSATDGSALSRDLLIEMLNAAAKNNAGGDKAGWLLSPTLRESLQKLKTDTGSGLFVWSPDMANSLLGYTAAVTTFMPSTLTKGTLSGTGKGAAFGYWDNLHIANWATRELIVDAASSDSGVVLKMVSFWDWAFANPKAFAIATII